MGRISLLLFSLYILINSCQPDEKIEYDTVLKAGNIINLEDGTIEKGDIFISDGKIALISKDSTRNNYLAKEIVVAKDKYILPGFWDNHVHFRGGDSLIEANKRFLGLFIANGITTVRDAGGDLTSAVMSWKADIEKGNLVGPNIFTSGPKIDGPGATWAGSLEVENKEDIANAMDSLESIPTDFVKIYDSRISAENYINTIKAAEQRNMITSGHMPFTVKLGQTIEAGVDAIEHLYYVMKGCSSNEAEITQKLQNGELGFWGAMPLLQNTFHDSVAQNTFNQLKSHNVFVVPTLHIGHTLSYLDETDHSQDSYLKYMSPGIQKTYEGRINSAKRASERAIADRKALDSFFQELTLKLNLNGVSLLAGSDSGAFNSYTYPGISLHQEMEAMVKAGIPELDALKSSAYNGAHFLKKTENYGGLDQDKVADIVILEDNPLENIKNTQHIFMVVKKGEIHTKEALTQFLK